MTGKNLSIVSIVVVVGLVALVFAVGGGVFKNFSISTNGLNVEIPSSMEVDYFGSQALIEYTVQNYVSTGNNYLVSSYVDGNLFGSSIYGGSHGSFPIIFSANGEHNVYLHVECVGDPSVFGDSGVMVAYVGVDGPGQTPVPHPSPTTPYGATPSPTPFNGDGDRSFVQQIADFLSSIFQPLIDWIMDFLGSLGAPS